MPWLQACRALCCTSLLVTVAVTHQAAHGVSGYHRQLVSNRHNMQPYLCKSLPVGTHKVGMNLAAADAICRT